MTTTCICLILWALVLFQQSTSCYEVTLFQTGKLQWNFDGSAKFVKFSLVLPRDEIMDDHGFGFGFSNHGETTEADILVIYMKREKINIMDCNTDRNGILRRDLKQNYQFLYSEMGLNYVKVTFQRLFETCDPNDYSIDNGTTNILCVFGLPTPFGLNTEIYRLFKTVSLKNYKHERTFVQLLKPSYDKDGTKTYMSFDVLAPNITIPNVETTYWCSVHQLPIFDKKVHGTGYTKVAAELNNKLVHHMEVFGCDISDGEIPSYNGLCDANDVPDKVKRCSRVLAAWAFGAEAFYYPEEAGFTFYSSTKSRFVKLEIHYNNQKNLEGVVDQSGIRFFYTDKLRKYEVGVIETGVIYSPVMGIPSNQQKFQWTGFCPGECTKKAFPQDGINIFAYELHAHLAGRKVWDSHFRDNHELPELSRDNHYSTWFEEIRKITPPRNVLPGDSLLTTCEFSTEGRANVTIGGSGILDEMCVSYLFYYPASDLEVCKSSISTTALEAYFAVQHTRMYGFFWKETYEKNFDYQSTVWDREATEQLAYLYRNAPVRVDCLKPNGAKWEGEWNNFNHPPFPDIEQKPFKSNCKHISP